MSDTQTTPPATTPAWNSKTVIWAVAAFAGFFPSWLQGSGLLAPGTLPKWLLVTLQGVASVCGLLSAYFAALRSSQGVENLAVAVRTAQATATGAAVVANNASENAAEARSATARMPLG